MRDMKAEDIMVQPVVSARESSVAKEIALVLLNGHFTGMPVIDGEDKVVGVITEFDLLKAVTAGKPLTKTLVKDLMNKEPITADVNTHLSEIVRIMMEKNILRLPITNGGKLVGIVARQDILRSQLDPSLFIL